MAHSFGRNLATRLRGFVQKFAHSWQAFAFSTVSAGSLLRYLPGTVRSEEVWGGGWFASGLGREQRKIGLLLWESGSKRCLALGQARGWRALNPGPPVRARP